MSLTRTGMVEPSRALLVVCVLVSVWWSSLALGQAKRESTVGMPVRIEALVLPGPELEAMPGESRSPLVLRIVATYPHGTDFRYDIEYWGLDPGDYDLRDYLRLKQRASTQDPEGGPRLPAAIELPPIPVSVRSVLPPGQVKPHAPGAGDVPAFGGYKLLLIAGGVIWVAGLLALLLAGRRRKAAQAERARPRTLAERLRPLVERALAGQLSRADRAQLELSLVAYWRARLGLEEHRPADVLTLLREHAEAGPLLRSLEEWLHMPPALSGAGVDVGALLAPYRDLPADALPSTLPTTTSKSA